jgi:hypothetical protein
MSTVPAEQYRIEQVQILNWGGYAGLQVMQAGARQHSHPWTFRPRQLHPPGRHGV